MKSLFILTCFLVSFTSYADVTVTFSGIVNKKSIDTLINKVEKAINKQDKLEQKVVSIRLNSVGGEIFHALRFVDYANKRNQEGQIEINTTHLGSRRICDSSCTILFTAGYKRMAKPKAKFGFHSPKYESGAPKGVTAEQIEETYRKIWLDYISKVDPALSENLISLGYLNSYRMSYIDAQEMYPGYVTDLLN